MAQITVDEAIQRIIAASPDQGTGLKKSKAKASPLEFVRSLSDKVYLLRRGNSGFAAPADDDLVPLLGECEDGDFTLDLPPNLRDWLEEYVGEVDWHQNGQVLIEDESPAIYAPAEYADAAARVDIPYMVKATWSQGTPYNNHLVFDAFDGKKCVVGCVAITVGQLMQYWGTKGLHRGCTATTKYRWSGSEVTVQALPPITVFDYANITPGKPKTTEQIEAVATLLEYVGKALKLDYSPSGTGGYLSVYSVMMRDRLRLGKSIKTIAAGTLGNDAFFQSVYEELAAGKPVAMSGGNSNGRHSFICDGYRTKDDKFHFNWGWGGSYNGWFAGTALNPTTGYTYNNTKYAILNIKPEYILGDVNGDGHVDVTDVMTIVDHVLTDKFDEKADVNADGTVSNADVMVDVDAILGKRKL